MLDTTQTLTHVYPLYNALNREITYKSEIIPNCSWFRTQIQSLENGIIKSGDVVKVRIPTQTRYPEIKKGDVLINGKADIEGLTVAQIRKKYPDSMEVQSVTYNLNSLPYSRHIRISGS